MIHSDFVLTCTGLHLAHTCASLRHMVDLAVLVGLSYFHDSMTLCYHKYVFHKLGRIQAPKEEGNEETCFLLQKLNGSSLAQLFLLKNKPNR